MIYDNAGGIYQRFLEVGSGTSVLQKQKQNKKEKQKNPPKHQYFTKTDINHYEMHHQTHIRNNWLDSIFFAPGDSHTKGSLCPLRLLPPLRLLHSF